MKGPNESLKSAIEALERVARHAAAWVEEGRVNPPEPRATLLALQKMVESAHANAAAIVNAAGTDEHTAVKAATSSRIPSDLTSAGSGAAGGCSPLTSAPVTVRSSGGWIPRDRTVEKLFDSPSMSDAPGP